MTKLKQGFTNVRFWLKCLFVASFARQNLLAYMGMLCRKYCDDGWTEGTEFILFETLHSGDLGKYSLNKAERRRFRAFYLLGRKHWWHFPDHVAAPYPISSEDWDNIPRPENLAAREGEDGQAEFRTRLRIVN